MSTRPQTMYGLADSPIDLAAFAIDHGDGTGQPGLVGQVIEGHPQGDLTRDDVLDNLTLYWLTNTGVSAARLYWENKRNRESRMGTLKPCRCPSDPASTTSSSNSTMSSAHTWRR